jgi:hypothetical protein
LIGSRQTLRPARSEPLCSGVADGVQLHRKIWFAVICHACGKNFGDVLVVHHRKYLPFSFETREDLGTWSVCVDQLQCNTTLDGLLLVHYENLPYATLADWLQGLVGADSLGNTASFLWRRFRRRGESWSGRRIQVEVFRLSQEHPDHPRVQTR